MNERIWLFAFLFFAFACGNEPQKEKKKEPATFPPQYYYYPRANVYFDSANKNYLFIANDGKTWQEAKQIPNIVQGLMDKSVLIQQPSQPVWRDNEQHRLVYSALLYATPNDTIVKAEPPKPVAKPPVEKTDEKKAKKGVGKFFDKIFGIFKKSKKKKDSL